MQFVGWAFRVSMAATLNSRGLPVGAETPLFTPASRRIYAAVTDRAIRSETLGLVQVVHAQARELGDDLRSLARTRSRLSQAGYRRAAVGQPAVFECGL